MFPGLHIAHYTGQTMQLLGKRVKDTPFKSSGGIDEYIILHCGTAAESAAKAESLWYLVREPEGATGKMHEQWAWLSEKDDTLRKLQPTTRDKKFHGILQDKALCKVACENKNERVLEFDVASPKGKKFTFSVRARYVPAPFFSKVKAAVREAEKGTKPAKTKDTSSAGPGISQEMREAVDVFTGSKLETGPMETTEKGGQKRKKKGNGQVDGNGGKRKKGAPANAAKSVLQTAHDMAVASGDACPVAKTSPVTPVNVLAYMEWQRMRGDPLAGNVRFGHLKNMGQFIDKTEANRVPLWLYNALRLAHDEWRDQFFTAPKPNEEGNEKGMSFEEEALHLFA